MSRDEVFRRYATEYDPIKIGSIDGTDSEPHDRALVRARNSEYSCNKLVKGDPYRTFGEIRHIRLVKDIVTGKSKRYAFVEFKSLNSVDKALSGMHKEDVDRAQVTVELEAERRLRGWRPRRLGGGFGGMKESGQLRFGCKERPFAKPIHLQKNNNEASRKRLNEKFTILFLNFPGKHKDD
ncbi:U11/U12 small nuclear ribonucleoprotein 35 kDa protein [Operophtera brumata]|uniref:U11/U12 small nuclear ribonucleoprotein 35 kDa protein n=1 Tax=Operophtera brumata TaxID=104452 RepID=A0A0L7LDN5_OPEBR|nr:U11/U12 small nuclear ribonucleoprotein 35 kDa protein [Operophtera brumata]